jgi:glycosyltransferase involved in cell wall biosynthesis
MNDRLRVGIDGRAFQSPAAGVRRYVQELTGALAATSDVELVAIGAPQHQHLPEHVVVAHEGWSPPTNLGRHLVGLPMGIERASVDLFHAPAYTAPLWGATSIVLTVQDVSYARRPEWYPYRQDRWRRAFYRRSAARARAIITASEFSKNEIVAAYGIDGERIHVTYLGVSGAFVRAAEHPSRGSLPEALEGRLFALHVGDLHPRRNLDTALRAVARVRQEHPACRDLCLALSGVDRGSAAVLVAEADRLGASNALVLLGAVSEEALLNLYRGAAVLVYPSRYEGFGLPLVEAMATGLPVIAARAGAIPEVVADAGVLLDPDDEEGFAQSIARVLLDAEYARALAEAGRFRAGRFTWADTARRTLQVYRAVLRQN